MKYIIFNISVCLQRPTLNIHQDTHPARWLSVFPVLCRSWARFPGIIKWHLVGNPVDESRLQSTNIGQQNNGSGKPTFPLVILLKPPVSVTTVDSQGEPCDWLSSFRENSFTARMHRTEKFICEMDLFRIMFDRRFQSGVVKSEIYPSRMFVVGKFEVSH